LWKGTAEEFVIYWESQCDSLQKMTPSENHLTDNLKLVMLQNAVNNVPELFQVKTEAMQIKVSTRKDITYDSYYALLESAAVSIDSSLGKVTSGKPDIVVNMVDDSNASPDGEMGDNSTIPHVQDNGKEKSHCKLPVIDPDNWIGCTYLMDEEEDGSQYHAHIICAVKDHNQLDCMKFVVSVNDDEFKDIVTYNELMDYFGKAEDESGQLWKFCHTVSHQGPLKQNPPDFNGSSYNIMLEWENGEKMPEPLDVVAKDNPITCAVYAKENGLLDAPGWKQFKPIAHHHKKFLQMVNQAKLCSFHTAPRYKYGYEIPRDYNHAIHLDEKCGSARHYCFGDCSAS
jgi:hypothetical protein